MRASVLVPSYRRPQDLARCLAAIAAQERPAEQVLVVARKGDEETYAVVREWQPRLPLELVEVETPGQVQALNAGLARCTSDVVAITDDDAAPRPQWLRRIVGHFESDPKIAGVGGRDWLYEDGRLLAGEKAVVGRVLWFGRIVGHHHLGAGSVRDVDILKGANCSFRMTAIAGLGFDRRLKGAGAQVHNDMMLCLALRRAGWRLVYDPEAAVDHYTGKRYDQDQRQKLNREATINRAFNLRLTMNEIKPRHRQMAALTWQLVVGVREAPGLVWVVRHKLAGRTGIPAVYRATLQGWRQGARATRLPRGNTV